jgi:hypothetical protein
MLLPRKAWMKTIQKNTLQQGLEFGVGQLQSGRSWVMRYAAELTAVTSEIRQRLS